MRKSKSSYLSRLLGAGIAASTVTAITLVAPSVAWAAVTGTITPNIVAPNTSGVIVENSTYTYGAGHYAQVQTGASCASHYTTQNSTTIWDAAQTAGAAHQISLTIPASVTVGEAPGHVRDTDMALAESGVAAPPGSSESCLSHDARRMLRAIEGLPEAEREVFELVRIQGLPHAEAAGVVGVSVKTVQRRLNRARLLLAEQLADLRPDAPDGTPGAPGDTPSS